MNATDLPGAAQVTATPRSVTALRQTRPWTRQLPREAASGIVQFSALTQEEATLRPSAQPTPVTRTASTPFPAAPHAFARVPAGAPEGAAPVDSVLAGTVVSVPVSSEEEPQPANAAAVARTTAIRVIDARKGFTAANLARELESAGDRFVEHRLCQRAGEGVLLARVVGADQAPGADHGLGAMAETGLGPRRLDPEAAKGP